MVTILILIDGFLQFNTFSYIKSVLAVTILILIDGFLQYLFEILVFKQKKESQSLF